MILKIADWFLVCASSITLIVNISTIYGKKANYIAIKQLNPDLSASPFFSTVVLSPVVSTIIIGIIIAAAILNVVKEFYISSMKRRIITNLFLYSISIFVTIKLYFMLN